MNKLWLFACVCVTASISSAEDHFLVIGGGYSPSGNQLSLEKNVLFFQRVLRDNQLHKRPNFTYFADGNATGADLEVLDRDAVPKPNRLMAEFLGSRTNLGLTYRNHKVPNVRGATSPENIRKWFTENGRRMRSGDRLVVYVTAHGSGSRDRSRPYETTIAMWNNKSIRVSEFVEMLDTLPEGVEVAVVMVQCHAGGFARFIFEDADPKKGLSKQKRVGFFATVHDRQAAGCTSEIDESSYVEYSTYFWAALSGRDRLGNKIERPDYDGDGIVSFDEAHAYTVLTAHTIDLPLKTSGEFLTVHGRYGESGSDKLPDDPPYDVVLELATPSERAVLEGLSKELNLTGQDRIMDAHNRSRRTNSRNRGGYRNRRTDTPVAQLRRKIATDLKKRWPALANLLNPEVVELLTVRSDEFVKAVEGHRDYERYRSLADAPVANEQKSRVKYERFLRTVDNVIFAENLKRGDNQELYEQYQAIVAAERGTLERPATSPGSDDTEGR